MIIFNAFLHSGVFAFYNLGLHQCYFLTLFLFSLIVPYSIHFLLSISFVLKNFFSSFYSFFQNTLDLSTVLRFMILLKGVFF